MKKHAGKHPDPMPSPQDIAVASSEIRWGFGSFIVWEAQRRLESFGQEVRLGSRSFDLLLQLLKRAGELVSKDELLSAVWGNVVVEEASVRVHMSQLRKALGEPGEGDDCKEWISNIPLRGYRFNGRVLRELIDASARIKARPPTALAKLPARMTELIGRETDVDNVLKSLDSHRLVTIVGPGGIGKTSVATRVAERRQQTPAVEVGFVDLAPLISQDHVLSTIARSLGAAADLSDPVQAIIQCLTGRNVLVVIDNCEQVMDSLVLPITRMLSALPGLRILATSRETLRVFGEYVYRLPALEVPDAEHFLLAQAMRWSSVEMLVELAKAAGARDFTESDGPLLAKISRQLEGIPLAIELVAARLGVQSVADLALRLDDHMRLLSIGNRAASARHQSLAAALDWSVALLNDDELRVFRRLSVFRGRLDVDRALAVAMGDMDRDVAFDALISLANKSLVSFDRNDAIAPYRLLDTTRSYAAGLLEQSGELPTMLRRHAKLMLDLMKAAAADLPKLVEQAWGERYGHCLDDVRFALTVCLTEQVDAETAASLVTSSSPLWFHLSQVAEYRDTVVTALKLIDQQPEPDIETATWLTTQLVITLLHTDRINPELDAACDRALAGALALKSRVLESQARWGRCTHDMFRGEYAAALLHSEALLAVAQSWDDPAALNLAHRVSAMANHFCGHFELSRQHCAESLRLSDGARRTRTSMVGVSPVVAAKALLSRTLWIQGETSNALETASDAVRLAEATGHAASLCAALFGGCPVALWSGEFELAGTWIEMMRGEARRRGLVGWLRYADWYYQGLQLHITSNPGLHIREVSARLATYDAPYKEMLVTFCTDWVDDGMVARLAAGEGLWCAAEVWRAMGQRNERSGMTADAEKDYLRALDLSRAQGAKGWELRAASSLARLWAGLDRPKEAIQLLDETHENIVPDVRNRAITQIRELREAVAQGAKLTL
jgi:predicted ATPase/DNA-binding winged helix-turn-helix (wHTH) protein